MLQKKKKTHLITSITHELNGFEFWPHMLEVAMA